MWTLHQDEAPPALGPCTNRRAPLSHVLRLRRHTQHRYYLQVLRQHIRVHVSNSDRKMQLLSSRDGGMHTLHLLSNVGHTVGTGPHGCQVLLELY